MAIEVQTKSDKKEESSKKDWNLMEFCVPITEANSSGKDFFIKGVAINETTTRNGITYVAEELSKAAASFRNKPILKDHNPLIENIVGRTTENVIWNETNKRIDFEARIVDKDIREKIESGLITDVSIGAKVADIIENKKAGTLTAVGMEGLEISLVAVPGDPGANIANAMHESFSLKENSNLTKLPKEVNQMTNEEVTPVEDVADKKEAPVEAEAETSESETAEKLKIATEKIAKYEAKEAEEKFKAAVTEEVAKQLAAKEDTEAEEPAAEVEAEEKPAEVEDKADTEVEDKSSSEEPMEDKTTGDVADKAEPEEASTESMTLEDAEAGKGFAIYREYSRDNSGKLNRLCRF